LCWFIHDVSPRRAERQVHEFLTEVIVPILAQTDAAGKIIAQACDSPGLADTIARGWLTDRRLLNPEGTIYGAKDS
jgi:hypothetical protein